MKTVLKLAGEFVSLAVLMIIYGFAYVALCSFTDLTETEAYRFAVLYCLAKITIISATKKNKEDEE